MRYANYSYPIHVLVLMQNLEIAQLSMFLEYNSAGIHFICWFDSKQKTKLDRIWLELDTGLNSLIK